LSRFVKQVIGPSGIAAPTRWKELRKFDAIYIAKTHRESAPMVTVGSQYGGWSVPKASLKKGATAICVGAGEDITFDISLNGEYQMDVFVVDPTPRAIRHVEGILDAARAGKTFSVNNSATERYDLAQFDERRFHLCAVALWTYDGVVEFYPPENERHVSHSIVNLQKATRAPLRVPCRTFETLARDCRIDRVEILKIDIEGAEYEVLRNLMRSKLRPRIICVEYDEYHHPQDDLWFDRVKQSIDLLEHTGYQLTRKESCNFTFCYSASEKMRA